MKNKKLFAILTLVCFMFTLMPVAAFAYETTDLAFDIDANGDAQLKVYVCPVENGKIAQGTKDLSAVVDATKYVVVSSAAVGETVPATEKTMTGAEIKAAADAAEAKAAENAVRGALSNKASVFATVTANEEVTKGEVVAAQISLKDRTGAAYKGAKQPVYVWAETTAGQVNDALVVEANAEKLAGKRANLDGVWEVEVPANTSVAELDLSFLRAGTYTLKAATTAPTTEKVSDTDGVAPFEGGNATVKTVVVNPAAQETEFWGVQVNGAAVIEDGETYAAADGKALITVDANGVKTEEVVLTVLWGSETVDPAVSGTTITGYPVKLDTNSSNIELSGTEFYADHNGQVKFKLAGLREGVYKVYVTVGDMECAILVQVGASIANDIEVIEAPEALVAKDTKIAEYASLIQFEITDVNGNVVTGDGIGNCTTANPAKNSDAAAYVTILEQPAASKLEDQNIWIEADGDHYVLALTSGKNFDVEGTYTVKVILDNGRFATVTWEVKKFQTPVEIVIDVPEMVELGTAFTAEMTYVDANGVEKLATKDADLTATGYAIATFAYDGDEDGTVTVKTDEKYAGSVITVTAVSERYNLVATKEVKVAAEAVAIEFENDTLAVNVNNKVEWNVVDAEGNAVTLDDNNVAESVIRYVVLDKPEDAKVSIYDNTDKPFDGSGEMALTSNKVGNVTVQVIAQVVFGDDDADTVKAEQTKYYTGVQIFAVGTEGVGDVVVMSIGSNEIVINDAKATIDAAPIVENNRTFVPFRALAEAFGATVAYDEATQAVTAELNGVTVVMTIGSAEYTVNGEAKTADVAPFINGSRTMVPVRFAAEAFGIKVIPTYDENGATADILFNL